MGMIGSEGINLKNEDFMRIRVIELLRSNR